MWSRQNCRKIGRLEPKLTRTVLATVFAACLLIFIISIYSSYNNSRNQEISTQRYQLDKTSAQISTLQNTIKNIGKQVLYDDVIQKGITAQVNSSGYYLYLRRNAQSTLTNYSHIIDGIHEIMIYTTDGRTFSSREIKDPFEPEEHEWYQDYINSGRRNGFTNIHRSEKNQDGTVKDVFSYFMTYYSVENAREILGTLVISVEFEELEKIAYLESDLLKGYCLYDKNKSPLIQRGELNQSYDEIMAQNKNGLVEENGVDVYIVSKDMHDSWVLVSEISGTGLVIQSLASNMYLLLIFVGIMITLLLILRLFIGRIVNPINQLSEAAVDVGRGNFNLSVNIQTNDELEMLAEVFNKMVVDIREFMHESVEHEKVLRRMQIENLMLQINPHFIYNTMNSIVYMARMNGNPQIADFANAFISLLQSTLKVKDSVYSTVREELNTVENYLYLQKYRYSDKFTYEIDCDEELMDCQILNVMMQPAVENAIFHGISPKDSACVLRISITRQREILKVCIEDDGIGMSHERLEEVMKSGTVQKGGIRKIGIANVRDRIKEIFGEPYSLMIESEPDVGTKVVMTLPFMKMNKEGEKDEK